MTKNSWILLAACCALLSTIATPFLGAQEDPPQKAKTDPRKGPKQPASPDLGEEDMQQIREILSKLQKAFLKGKVQQVMDLFGPKRTEDIANDQRLIAIQSSLEQEFQNEQYHSFDILDDPLPDDKLAGRRHSVWVRIRIGISEKVHDTDKKTAAQFIRETNQNNIFVFTQNRRGKFLLFDSPFFDTIGKRRTFSDTLGRRKGFFRNYILLGFTGLLAVMGFWVWMGFLVFRMRPRSIFWRLLIMVPVLGAGAYFILVYLPGWLRGGETQGAD